ncbi:SGNH/GDSL hydrolase family protein [Vagococcus carniphilus]|uniref:SGNH/GDSL hydrolase family protein n=1 Tax=Vagococcus carniphilus TaxID=218144 RepID=UPI00288FF3DE|nr:GDSL-type esterase/lipase family protein [Vagococcus carniphilus]MDT2816162.1 GDSL-type esterase/lipase family protein [Vagococcus carniphilus]MDT2865894.1 GDSL-type esterase/lipase family protein [Vagococcus carniphilus]HBM6538970.1 lipase [Enterococcus faecium]HBM6539204.1 lipase [Enterococcus faecium]
MKKIILFGDSITAGYENGLTDFRLNERIMAQVEDVEIINAGIPGDTTRGARARLNDHVLKYDPDIVTVFFGANDVSNVTGLSIEEYEENLDEIVKEIGISKVILIGVPFCDQTIYQSERPMDQLKVFNSVAQKLTTKYRLDYIDMLSEMQQVDPSIYLQRDGIHFSNEGYDLLGQLISQTINNR